MIIGHVDEEDKYHVRLLETAKDQWTYLEKNYNRKIAQYSRQFEQDYVIYKVKDGDTIRLAWSTPIWKGLQMKGKDFTLEDAYQLLKNTLISFLFHCQDAGSWPI